MWGAYGSKPADPLGPIPSRGNTTDRPVETVCQHALCDDESRSLVVMCATGINDRIQVFNTDERLSERDSSRRQQRLGSAHALGFSPDKDQRLCMSETARARKSGFSSVTI